MESREYWEKRAEANDVRTQAQMDAGILKLQKAFETAEEVLQSRIETFIAKYSEDEGIDFANLRTRLTATELASFRRQLNRLESSATTAEMKALIRSLKKRSYLSRQEALLAEVRYHITELTSETERTIEESMADIYSERESMQRYHIEQDLGQGVNFEKLAPAQIHALIHQGYDGRDFSSKVWYSRDQLLLYLDRFLPQQFILGSSVQTLASALSKAMNTPRYAAEALIRTEGSHIAAQADMHVYTEVGLEEYEFLATIDNRTSEECEALDGKVFYVKDAVTGVNLPPIHTNCRSTTIPVVDMTGISEERLAKDADGKYIKVSKSWTLSQWRARRES